MFILELVSLCDKHLLVPNFVGGTRYDKRSKSESKIDQTFSDSAMIDKPVILKTDHSDYYLLQASYYVQNVKQEENDDKCPNDDSVLDLKNLDIDETKNQLWNTDWEAIINHDKPEEMMNKFTKTVRATLLENGAKIKRDRGDKEDDKHPSIKQLLKSIKNTRRRLQKNLEDEERAHLIIVKNQKLR